MNRFLPRLIGSSIVIGALHMLSATALQQFAYRPFQETVTTYGKKTTVFDDTNEVTITNGPIGPREARIGLEGNASEQPEQMISALERELAQAPGFYTDTCRLAYVRIVESLEQNNEPLDGFYKKGTIYLDTDTLEPHAVVVHELNHLCVDTNRHGFATLWNLRFNRLTGTRYAGNGWRNVRASEFSSNYGSKNWSEDVATIAEDLLSTGRPNDDPRYQEKRALVASFYQRIGDPRFEDLTSITNDHGTAMNAESRSEIANASPANICANHTTR